MEKYGIADVSAFNERKRQCTELVYFTEWRGVLLNLSFVSPHGALMCTPSSTDFWKRNDVRIIADFVHETYGQHFYLINLHEQCYDAGLFDNQVLFLPCPDHCAPRLSYFLSITGSMVEIRDRDPDVVFFVHCKAGRGRSGMILVAYDLRIGYISSASEGILTVNAKRSPDGIGISIPSQSRFLRYFERLCQDGAPIHRRIRIFGVEFLPGLNREMYFVISTGIPFEDPDGEKVTFTGNAIHFREVDLIVENEFFIRLYDTGKDDDCVRIQLHSDFLVDGFEKVQALENGEFVALFENVEIEGPHHRKTGKNFPPGFKMTITFGIVP
jgi:protein-tyrosine phosphatase